MGRRRPPRDARGQTHLFDCEVFCQRCGRRLRTDRAVKDRLGRRCRQISRAAADKRSTAKHAKSAKARLLAQAIRAVEQLAGSPLALNAYSPKDASCYDCAVESPFPAK